MAGVSRVGASLLLGFIVGCAAPRNQAEALSPVGTYWKLIQLESETIAVRDNEREPYLVFQDKDERVTGFGG